MNAKFLLRNAAAALGLLLAGALGWTLTAPIAQSASANTVVVDQDIDLFLGSTSSSCSCANVIIFIDNSSNSSQAFSPADGSAKSTRLDLEISAIRQVLPNLPSTLNVGIMTGNLTSQETIGKSAGGNGGVVRFAIRPLGATGSAVRTALDNLLAGFSKTADATSGSTAYTLALHDAYTYFAGLPVMYDHAWGTTAYPGHYSPNSPITAGLCTTTAKCLSLGYTQPVNGYYPPFAGDMDTYTGTAKLADPAGYGQARVDDGILKYGATPTIVNMGDNGAFVQASLTGSLKFHTMKTPVTSTCTKNYIIFVSNGTIGTTADNTTTKGNSTSVNYSAHDMMIFDGADPTPISLTGVADALDTTHTYSGSTNGPASDLANSYLKFLHNNNMVSTIANSNVTTYVVEPWSAGNITSGDYDMEIYLQSMATQGGGKYYRANGVSDLIKDFTAIFNEIDAVNSVFAAAALPVSANVRGTNLNQVYLGVFRPDSNGLPRWYGNLKEYQLGVSGTTLTLEDSLGAAAENSTTGFISPNVTSFWTTASTYWGWRASTLNGTGGSSDAPDGDLVEKGAAAEVLRNTYATSQSGRKLYTCTGTCTSGSSLSATPFNSSNTALTQAALGTSSSTDTTNLIAWVQGTNNATSINSNTSGANDGYATTPTVRSSIHGDVLHSQPGVINYNRNGDNNDIYVFYGDNSGVFHEIQGANATGAGQEMWGFIPTEFFSQLTTLRADANTLSTSNPKPYFFDGPVTTYTLDANNDEKITNGDSSGDKAYIYITSHRGGRVLYALDVTNPGTTSTAADPKLLWKATNSTTGFSELGQTWSQVSVTKIKANTNPVAIFGGGYDATAEDPVTSAGVPNPGTDTMGRGIFIVDAYTGALLWQAGPSPTGATYNTTVSGMTYSIPSAIAVYDSDRDGFADRLYFGDTGGNVWRVDISDATPSNWKVTKLASLGGTGTNARKFLFPPDVVYNNDSTGTYDAVLIGSGDREHPFDTTVVNRFYMLKDTHALLEPATFTTLTESKLFDATSDAIQVGTAAQQSAAAISLAGASGWYITFSGSGEKDVGGDVAIQGSVVFNTYTPTTSASCTPSLGTATQYIVSYKDASATINLTGQTNMVAADRSQNIAGGGFVPTPVHISIPSSTGTIVQGVVSGTNVYSFPVAAGLRLRVYWKKTAG